MCFADWENDDEPDWDAAQVIFNSLKVEKRSGAGRWEIPHQRPVPVHMVTVEELVDKGFLGPLEKGVRQFRYADRITTDESKQYFPVNPNNRYREWPDDKSHNLVTESEGWNRVYCLDIALTDNKWAFLFVLASAEWGGSRSFPVLGVLGAHGDYAVGVEQTGPLFRTEVIRKPEITLFKNTWIENNFSGDTSNFLTCPEGYGLLYSAPVLKNNYHVHWEGYLIKCVHN